jgi:hypothetical protein
MMLYYFVKIYYPFIGKFSFHKNISGKSCYLLITSYSLVTVDSLEIKDALIPGKEGCFASIKTALELL